MKIAFFNPVGFIGGAEKSLIDLMRSLRTKNPEVEVHLIMGTAGPLEKKCKDLGVRTHILEFPSALTALGDSDHSKWKTTLKALRVGPAVLQFQKQLRNLIQDIQPTVVHSNGMKCHILSALSVPKEIPVIWHVRDFLSSRPLMAKLLRPLSSRVSGCLAISEAVATDIENALPHTNVHVVYNAIDLTEFAPAPKRLEHTPLRVGLVGTFARWKGHELFIEAAHRLVSQKLEAEFWVVGGPIYKTQTSQYTRSELQDKVNALGLGKHFKFMDFQLDIAPIYRDLDIVVQASTQPEPFGRTIVEAMACGTPTVVSRTGGAKELFNDGTDALGFQPGSAAELSEALKKLLENPTLRQSLTRHGLENVHTRFSSERLATDVLRAYKGFQIPFLTVTRAATG